MTLGWHWILDALDCEPALLADRTVLARALTELPQRLGLTRVGEPQIFEHHDGDEQTLAGITLLAESHLSLHARPAQRALHVDLFSCAPFDPAAARAHLRALYPFVEAREQTLERGGPVRR